MYLLPKIHKKLHKACIRQVVLLFLPVVYQRKYIKDTSDFSNKLKSLGKVPDNAILFTADVVGLSPIIPHKDRLNVLSAKLEEAKTAFT